MRRGLIEESEVFGLPPKITLKLNCFSVMVEGSEGDENRDMRVRDKLNSIKFFLSKNSIKIGFFVKNEN